MGFKAYIIPEPDPIPPTDWIDSRIKVLRSYPNNRYWNTYSHSWSNLKSDDGWRIGDFCNKNFSYEKLEEREYDEDVDESYFSHFGCICKEIDGGDNVFTVIAVNSEDAKKIWGKKTTPKMARQYLDDIAKEFDMLVDGEVYCAVLCEFDGMDDPEVEFAYSMDDIYRAYDDCDIVDSVGNIYGREGAIEYAKDLFNSGVGRD